jgi:DNA-binding MarR family transcriptional regulator
LSTVALVNYNDREMLISRRVLDLARKSKNAMVRRLPRTARPWMQLRVLQEIAEQAGVSQRSLAATLCFDPPAISRMVRTLERDGLIRRREADDRRRDALQITATGKRALALLEAEQAWLDDEMRAALSATEWAQLDKLLKKLDAAVAP